MDNNEEQEKADPKEHFKYDNLTFPKFQGLFPNAQKNFEEIREMECRQSDIFVCTFPKAGTHWTSEIVSMLIRNSSEYSIVDHRDLFLEYMTNRPKAKDWESPRLFVTHLPYKYLPAQLQNGTGRIIYVSLYNFNKSRIEAFKQMTWATYFNERIVVTGDVVYGGWFAYTREWERELERKNILSVYYEDMKMDLTGQTLKIANFLEIACSDDLASEINDKCSFDKMKKHRVDGTGNSESSDNKAFYRRGEVGDWKNWFTVQQNELFDQIYDEKMQDSKLKFLFTEKELKND